MKIRCNNAITNVSLISVCGTDFAAEWLSVNGMLADMTLSSEMVWECDTEKLLCIKKQIKEEQSRIKDGHYC